MNFFFVLSGFILVKSMLLRTTIRGSFGGVASPAFTPPTFSPSLSLRRLSP